MESEFLLQDPFLAGKENHHKRSRADTQSRLPSRRLFRDITFNLPQKKRKGFNFWPLTSTTQRSQLHINFGLDMFTFFLCQFALPFSKQNLTVIELRTPQLNLVYMLFLRKGFCTEKAYIKAQQAAYEKIKASIALTFKEPSLDAYVDSLSVRAILSKSADSFIGSYTCPKNKEFAQKLLNKSLNVARSEKEINETAYYSNYFKRMEALEEGKEEEFNETNEALIDLANRNHPQSQYLVGKQLDILLKAESDVEKRRQIGKKAVAYFQKSISEKQYGGLFYTAEIFRRVGILEASQQQINEIYMYGAAFGDPLSYFRLANIYYEKANRKLYLKYLKRAAEFGILEAQHDLGCAYLEGKIIPKDEVKALGWFLNASRNGFSYSGFNATMIFLKGSSCGRIKPSKQGVIFMLDLLQKKPNGMEEEIHQLMQEPRIKKIIQGYIQRKN